MKRQIMWTAQQWPGCEHLELCIDDDGIVADGLVLAAPDNTPVRLAYRIECDTAWNTRSVTIDFHHVRRNLARDMDGRWFDNGQERPDLAGCTDIDIALTPFTNTLPIRRLRLTPGAAADLRVVYIQPESELTIEPASQRYHRLGTGYRYESGDFRADLDIDADGLVIEYPALWTMVPSIAQ
ncbi:MULTISPECIES: putative glycolipid-binding domain-containing protein [Glycomyces]|uniref:Glycolipid-binding domain-containing protein n=2 Tax=Glycomyces TaxID=58113 RepID=A0A9X3PNI9_9ACTN|nr:putative glycolipid-binding domain-containing protein [Glycomyces lechevalierae]MDA1388242.1 putative glycolipid-binding domain-containing protein [Glycomyces lechevalierae]MDR7337315.1 hypothetical protein [Glycomyces lechevalierae]